MNNFRPRRRLPVPTTLTEWLAYAKRNGRGKWPTLAIGAIVSVVHANPSVSEGELAEMVDAAYPFDAREHWPYRVWLRERKLFLGALNGDLTQEPTDEDRAAVDVAIDMAEIGRVDEAKKLLDEQAPRRLNRECPACGAKAGKPCRGQRDDVVCPMCDGAGLRNVNPHLRPPNTCPVCKGAKFMPNLVDLVVPHVSRVAAPSNGPLFARTA